MNVLGKLWHNLADLTTSKPSNSSSPSSIISPPPSSIISPPPSSIISPASYYMSSATNSYTYKHSDYWIINKWKELPPIPTSYYNLDCSSYSLYGLYIPKNSSNDL
ncbi:Hypothetical protein ORPV_1002 [Orpheovirus IHUMI-LCC2]|uniref:Uncharacterized protein n=1 Tax=Orpheovirus IHUMI-LCC2 TaxID=2023057 RepID=A0A2I2L5W4_9VIRU|nr:Hypothetical protein ORPV_1002 [Orpheovirus IHUMI-LCC2]SNW62906.1 Hypothetical protein ORPV_1002 [Orpheovirus IHUMI-LCC2]